MLVAVEADKRVRVAVIHQVLGMVIPDIPFGYGGLLHLGRHRYLQAEGILGQFQRNGFLFIVHHSQVAHIALGHAGSCRHTGPLLTVGTDHHGVVGQQSIGHGQFDHLGGLYETHAHPLSFLQGICLGLYGINRTVTVAHRSLGTLHIAGIAGHFGLFGLSEIVSEGIFLHIGHEGHEHGFGSLGNTHRGADAAAHTFKGISLELFGGGEFLDMFQFGQIGSPPAVILPFCFGHFQKFSRGEGHGAEFVQPGSKVLVEQCLPFHGRILEGYHHVTIALDFLHPSDEC